MPAFVRWPGRIPAGSVSNEIFSGLDWFPTLLAAAGDTSVKERLLTGWQPQAGGRTYRLHLDGYNQLPYLTGQQPNSARKEFFYFNDDGQLVSMRYENTKLVFCEQREAGTIQIWREPFTCLRAPKMYNLRMDPYERADITSYLQRLDIQAVVPGGAGASAGRAVHRNVQAVPAAPDAGQLQRRSDHGNAGPAAGRVMAL